MSEYLMYLRKSRQDDASETIEQVLSKHEGMLQDYAISNFGYRMPNNDIYRELVSGELIDDRPAIKELFDRIEKEPIKGVLVVDCQRLTRGDMLDCGIVEHEFLYTNTLVITPPMTFDLSNKYSRQMFEAELRRGNDYLEYTKEILARGRHASAKKGNYICSVAPYGYDKIKVGKDCTLKINEQEAFYVRLAYEMYAEGIGANKISLKLEELGAKPRKGEFFTETVIRQMLSNPVYIGKVKWKSRETIKVMEDGKVVKKRIRKKEYETYDGKHEPIISEELFNICKDKIGKQSKENQNKELRFIYAGLLKCGICGRAMTMITMRKEGVEYRKPRIYCKRKTRCTNRTVNVEVVHNAILSKLKRHLSDLTVKVELDNGKNKKSHETQINAFEKQLKEIAYKQEKICEYLENGIYTTEMFLNRKKKLEQEREQIERALENLKKELPGIEKEKEQIISLHQALDMLDDENISVKAKNNFLKSFIKVIYYTRIDDYIDISIELL